jgi:very-short-patch-repair endonuclease
MKTSRIPTNLAKNASKLHKRVGELLVQLYPGYEIRQEYCVKKVNPEFSSGREKFDWVILKLNVVCEIHGEQHYKIVCFGGITEEEATKNLEKRKQVDAEKQKAAEEAGWAYIIIPYWDNKIDSDSLKKLIIEAIQNAKPYKVFNEKEKPKIQSRGFQKPPERHKYKWPKKKINQT